MVRAVQKSIRQMLKTHKKNKNSKKWCKKHWKIIRKVIKKWIKNHEKNDRKIDEKNDGFKINFYWFFGVAAGPMEVSRSSLRRWGARKSTCEKGKVHVRRERCVHQALHAPRARALAQGGFFDVDPEGQKIDKNRLQIDYT